MKLAQMFQCGKTQIQNILRRKAKYLDDWANKADPCRVRRGVSGQLLKHRNIMHEWLERCRCYPIKINDELLFSKAVEAARLMDITEFRINNEWMRRFKCKFKLYDDDLFNNDINTTIATSDQVEKKSMKIKDIISDLNTDTSLY